MKAEHRKELQTNSLADFLGNLMQKRQTGESAGVPWFKLGLVAVVCIGIFLFFWLRGNYARSNAEAWAKLDLGTSASLSSIEVEYKEAKQGEAARFTILYGALWEGIKFLGSGQPGRGERAKDFFEGQLIPEFKKLAEDCKDNPLLAAEAKYHVFVCREALTAVDLKYLEAAKEDLEELTKGDLAATPYGQMAKRRLEQYDNPLEKVDILMFYQRFRDQAAGPRG
jgi:hypothetical protein